MQIAKFKKTIWTRYRTHKRDFPWRRTRDPYKILVSEIMLQQTQAPRVVVKYTSFLKKFPNTKILAEAKLSDVLTEWQGLGYNRRALYLKRIAETIRPLSKYPESRCGEDRWEAVAVPGQVVASCDQVIL